MNDFNAFERRLARALRADADLSIPPVDPAKVARAAIDAEGTRSSSRRRSRASRATWLLVAATLLLGAGVVGASLVGDRRGVPTPQPSVLTGIVSPPATPEPGTTGALTPTPARTPAPAILAYLSIVTSPPAPIDNQLWLANVDGTGAHAVLPAASGSAEWPVWSPDGSRLVFSYRPPATQQDQVPPSDLARLYVTDAGGSDPQLVDTGCTAPCTGDSDAAFSPDGTQLVFVRSLALPAAYYGPGTGLHRSYTPASILATIDLSTGRVNELASTLIIDCPTLPGQRVPDTPNCEGLANHQPRWSPDGTQIAFAQDVPFDMNDTSMDGEPPPTATRLMVVDVDGGNPHQIAASGWHVAWSPDGTRIAFFSTRYLDITPFPGNNNGYTYTASSDIYTIRPDGTDRRQVTTNGASIVPSWTADGRIWYFRGARAKPWVMDSDGGNARSFSLPSSMPLFAIPNQPAVTILTQP